MFRTAIKPRRAVLSAAVAGTVVGGGVSQQSDKLSIYPSATPDILLVDSPSELENQIGVARRQAQSVYSDAHAEVQSWVAKWIGVEHAVEYRVKSIIAKDEPLTPGALYVGVATLTGSIIARNRFLPTRLLLPPIFLIASAQHFLPKTSHNLSAYLGSLEDRYFPSVAQTHDIAKAHSAMTWERVKDATKDGRASAGKAVTSAVDSIQEATGLKLRETFGWQKEQVHILEDKVETFKEEVGKKVKEEASKIEEEVGKHIDEVKSRV
ncbi:apolipo protein O-domain-containing protein [Crepidotus variabilis]|uniref:MICOS complex subunit n=1 Tax=Crepidotus variabilis TaxID=179855 RepID=A0A9P6JQ21_9AGAR|nr:apolipo protein O-domain-containing protein [Crepidotus variabilis]